MPADLPLFGVKSRSDATLQSFFPVFKSITTAGQGAAASSASSTANALDASIFSAYETQTKSRVWIDERELNTLGEELRYYLGNKDSDYYKAKLGMPLQFASLEEEIGFVFLMEALRFGSRYDRIFEEKTKNKRGSRDTIQFGLMAMFISGKPPHLADHLINNSTNHEISINFDFPIHESQALDFAKLGGVYKDVDGPLAPLATAIGKSMTEMGILLRSRQMNHLGELAVKLYSQIKGEKDALEFAKLIAKTLPTTFGDESNGVAFISKAQHCVYTLARRFPDRFALQNIDKLAAIVDAELVYALRKLGVLSLSTELQQKVDSEEHHKLSAGGKEEFALRIAAVVAVYRMSAPGGINEVVASEWICDKAINIVHQTIRPHVCETMSY